MLNICIIFFSIIEISGIAFISPRRILESALDDGLIHFDFRSVILPPPENFTVYSRFHSLLWFYSILNHNQIIQNHIPVADKKSGIAYSPPLKNLTKLRLFCTIILLNNINNQQKVNNRRLGRDWEFWEFWEQFPILPILPIIPIIKVAGKHYVDKISAIRFCGLPKFVIFASSVQIAERHGKENKITLYDYEEIQFQCRSIGFARRSPRKRSKSNHRFQRNGIVDSLDFASYERVRGGSGFGAVAVPRVAPYSGQLQDIFRRWRRKHTVLPYSGELSENQSRLRTHRSLDEEGDKGGETLRRGANHSVVGGQKLHVHSERIRDSVGFGLPLYLRQQHDLRLGVQDRHRFAGTAYRRHEFGHTEPTGRRVEIRDNLRRCAEKPRAGGSNVRNHPRRHVAESGPRTAVDGECQYARR